MPRSSAREGEKVWIWSRQHADYLPGTVVNVRAGVAAVSWKYGIERIAVGSLVRERPQPRRA